MKVLCIRCALIVMFTMVAACGSNNPPGTQIDDVPDIGVGCDACPDGTVSNTGDCSCNDIDECLLENGECHSNAVCTNAAQSGVSPTCVCDEGFIGDGISCTETTVCTETEYERTAATATTNRECTALTVCADEEYESKAPSVTSDRECTALTVCGDEEYENKAATATTDRECAALTLCTNEEYESKAATATTDRECAVLTLCTNEEYESKAATATTDRECAALTLCADGEYESKAPSATSDRECLVWSICGENEYESTPGTPTSDTACLAVSECDNESYETAAATPTSDTVCTPYINVPGLIQAEDYGVGGEGVFYHDASPGNAGAVYRDDDVDIEETDNGFVVLMQSGEWLGYPIFVEEKGTYTLTLWAQGLYPGYQVNIYVGDDAVALRVPVPTTDEPIVIERVELDAGAHTLVLSGGIHDGVVVDAFEIVNVGCDDPDDDGICTPDDCKPDDPECAYGLCCYTLVGHWEFEEGEGLTAADSSGNNNHGVLKADTQTTWVDGVSGTALDFAESGDSLKIVNSPTLEVGTSFTFSAWVWMSSETWGASFFSLRNKTAAEVRVVKKKYNKKDVRRFVGVACQAPWGGWTSCDVNGRRDFPVDAWHHIAFVVSETELTIYLDGVWESTETITKNTVSSENLPAYIGKSMVGKMDDVRLYDEALGAEEVARLYLKSPLMTTQCNDGLDNDNNGVADAPNDIGCSSVLDDRENTDRLAPGVPEDFAVVEQAPTMVHLAWTKSQDDEAHGGYNIYRDGTRVDTVMLPRFHDTNVVEGATYTYRVRSMDHAGNESLPSVEVSAQVPFWPVFEPGETIVVSPTDFAGYSSLKKLVESSPEGTVFVLQPGLYRLSATIFPRAGQSIIGQQGATLSGAIELDPAVVTQVDGLYAWPDLSIKDGTSNEPGGCLPENPGCLLHEDLYYDDVVLKRVMSKEAVVPGTFYTDYQSSGSTVYFKDNPTGHKVELSVTTNAISGFPNEVCCKTNNGFEWVAAKQCTADKLQKAPEDIAKCSDETCTPDCNAHVTIRGLIIEKFATVAQRGAIMAREYNYKGVAMRYWTVEQNDIRLNHGFGVNSGTYSRLRNNRIHSNGHMGGTVGSYSIMEGNEFSNNNWAGYKPSWSAGALKIVFNHYTVAKGNYVHHNPGHGMWVDINNYHVVLEDNISSHNEGDGYKYEISYDCSIRRNVGSNNHKKPKYGWLFDSFIMVQNSERCDVYGNHGEVAKEGNGITIIDQDRSYNDTVYHGVKNTIHRNWVSYAASSGASGAHNHDNVIDFNIYQATELYSNHFALPWMPWYFFQQTGFEAHGEYLVAPLPPQPVWGAPGVAWISPEAEPVVACDATPHLELSAVPDFDDQVALVEFFVDGVKLAQTSSHPYAVKWYYPNPGTYKLTAKVSTRRDQQATTPAVSLTIEACQ